MSTSLNTPVLSCSSPCFIEEVSFQLVQVLVTRVLKAVVLLSGLLLCFEPCLLDRLFQVLLPASVLWRFK